MDIHQDYRFQKNQPALGAAFVGFLTQGKSCSSDFHGASIWCFRRPTWRYYWRSTFTLLSIAWSTFDSTDLCVAWSPGGLICKDNGFSVFAWKKTNLDGLNFCLGLEFQWHTWPLWWTRRQAWNMFLVVCKWVVACWKKIEVTTDRWGGFLVLHGVWLPAKQRNVSWKSMIQV